jgi:hypothetical protein
MMEQWVPCQVSHDGDEALRLQVVRLQGYICELLLKNQRLRDNLLVSNTAGKEQSSQDGLPSLGVSV